MKKKHVFIDMTWMCRKKVVSVGKRVPPADFSPYFQTNPHHPHPFMDNLDNVLMKKKNAIFLYQRSQELENPREAAASRLHSSRSKEQSPTFPAAPWDCSRDWRMQWDPHLDALPRWPQALERLDGFRASSFESPKNLLVLNVGNGWKWGNGMIIHGDYGPFPHSLRLAPGRKRQQSSGI